MTDGGVGMTMGGASPTCHCEERIPPCHSEARTPKNLRRMYTRQVLVGMDWLAIEGRP